MIECSDSIDSDFILFLYGFILTKIASCWWLLWRLQTYWANLSLLKEGIISNLNSPDYTIVGSNIFIFHIYLNPFINSQEEFRVSNLIISLSIPLLLYFSSEKNTHS